MQITNEEVEIHISKLRNYWDRRSSKDCINREQYIALTGKLTLFKEINKQVLRLEQFAQQFESSSKLELELSEIGVPSKNSKRRNEILSICNELRAIILQEGADKIK